MSQRWKQRPDGSNWGDFGPDDQLGRLNLLTPEKIRQGAAEIREGLTFCLGLPLEYPGGNKLNPVRTPPILEPTTTPQGTPRFLFPRSVEDPRLTDVVCDDRVNLVCQYSSQWDSLAHVGSTFDADGDGDAEIRFYNGWRGGQDIIGPVRYDSDGNAIPVGPHRGALRLGIENMAVKGLQGRAVMVDLYRHAGRERIYVSYDGLMRAMAATGAEVETGDMLCLYTGFADMIVDSRGNPNADDLHNAYAVLDGRDEHLLRWITDSGVVALIADNYAVEGLPARPGTGARHASLPIHEHCLFKLGVYLGELWYLTELNAWLRDAGRSRFMLTAQPLRLTGAVGSPVTPIATV